jgi:hypothetical protein
VTTENAYDSKQSNAEIKFMRKTTCLFKTLALASAVLLGARVSTKATITLALENASSRSEYGFTATIPGFSDSIANYYIGVYRFYEIGIPDGSNPFYSVCLSPGGNLNWGTYKYDQLTFEQANPGANPATWAYSGSDLWGIQNANWLWRQFGSSATTPDKGAGLALAMFAALYNSTGYGQVDLSITAPFQVTYWADHTGAATAYYNDLTALTASGAFDTSKDIYYGYVLRPQEGQGIGQDFILIGTPVPEFTTLLAGALLLLPFGASTVRVMRRTRPA